MKKKLTLSIDESVSKMAKRMADREGTSISEMVEQYLLERSSSNRVWSAKEGTWTARLIGSVRLSDESRKKDYKSIKEEEILKKYGSS